MESKELNNAFCKWLDTLTTEQKASYMKQLEIVNNMSDLEFLEYLAKRYTDADESGIGTYIVNKETMVIEYRINKE